MATQKERILSDLKPGVPAVWQVWCLDEPNVMCGSLWLSQHMPRYAARINDLRNEGHRIETGRCKVHKTATYRLVTDD